MLSVLTNIFFFTMQIIVYTATYRLIGKTCLEHFFFFAKTILRCFLHISQRFQSEMSGAKRVFYLKQTLKQTSKCASLQIIL